MNGQHFNLSGSANGTPTPPSNSSYPASLSSQSSRDPSPSSRLNSLPQQFQFGNSGYGQQILTNSVTHTTGAADLKYQPNFYSQNPPQIWNNSSKGAMSFPNTFPAPHAINQNSAVSSSHTTAPANLITHSSGFSSTEYLSNNVSNRLESRGVNSSPQFNSIPKVSDVAHPIQNSTVDRVIRPPVNPMLDSLYTSQGVPSAHLNSNSTPGEQLLNEENKSQMLRFQTDQMVNTAASIVSPPHPLLQTQQQSPTPPLPSTTHSLPPQSEALRVSPQTSASSHSQDSSPKPPTSSPSVLHPYPINTQTSTKFLPPTASQYQSAVSHEVSAPPIMATSVASLQVSQVQTHDSSKTFANQTTHPTLSGSGDNESKPASNSVETSRQNNETGLYSQQAPAPVPPQLVKQNPQTMQQLQDGSQPTLKFPNTQANQFPPSSFGQFPTNELLAGGQAYQPPLPNLNSQFNNKQLGSNFEQYQKSQIPFSQAQQPPASLSESQNQPNRAGQFPSSIPDGQKDPSRNQPNRIGQFSQQAPPTSVGHQDPSQAQQNSIGQFPPQIPTSSVGQQNPSQTQQNRVGQFPHQIPPMSVGQQNPPRTQQTGVNQFPPQIPPTFVGKQDPSQIQQTRIGQFAPQIPPSVGQQNPPQSQQTRVGQFPPQIPATSVGQQGLSQAQHNRVGQFPPQIPPTSVGQKEPSSVDTSQFQPNPPSSNLAQQTVRTVGYDPPTSIGQNPPFSVGQAPLNPSQTARTNFSQITPTISAAQQQNALPIAPSANPQQPSLNKYTLPSASQPYTTNQLGQNQQTVHTVQPRPNQMPPMPRPNVPPTMTSAQIQQPGLMTSQFAPKLPPTGGQYPPQNVPASSNAGPFTGQSFQAPTNVASKQFGGPETNQFQNRYPNQLIQQNQYPRPTAPIGNMPYQQTAPTGPYMQNRYPSMVPPVQRTMDGLTNQLRSSTISQDGFNKLWGMDTYDLLKTRDLLPRDRIEAPPIKLNPELYDATNCNPELFRCTLSKIPESKSLLEKSRLPLGVLIHPFKDLNQLSVIQCSTIVRCRVCRTYINPFVYFVDNKRWKCNLCFRVNELPDEFQFDPISKTYGDPSRRPEIKSATIEFIAPSEYMVRPPQPAIYLFLLDVSRLGAECGYLNVVCQTLLEELENLPGDARTSVGFITYDSSVHFYSLAEGLSQPHQMVVVDIDEMFLPCPENLLVNLSESIDLIRDLLTQLPTLYSESFDTESALGAALQAAYKLLAPTGGRVTVFQARLPSKGPGTLIAREDPSQRAGDNVPHLNPSTDFYKKLALDCSSQQIAVDLFLINSQYVDVATLSGISRFSGGCMHHIPLFRAVNPLQVKMLKKSFQRYLTRKIGFESVMRLRCTRGLSIHTFHGNFFVRSTDLLSLPNVNPDAGFGMQVSIDESLSELQNVCFQAALLYTSSKGERRIRVHTLCLPIASSLSDVLNGADQHCIVGLLAKMAVDRSMESSISDAREAFVNVAADILSAYKLTQSSSSPGSVLAPKTLRLIPMYILALLKFVAFRIGQSTRLDDRVFAMCQMKSLPLAYLLQSLYPDLYPIHDLENQPVMEQGPDKEIIPNPPKLHLSAERIDSHGIYLLDNGSMLLMYVGHNVNPNLCQALFGVPHFTALPQDMYELPELDTTESDRLFTFIHNLTSEKSYVPCIQVIRDDSHHRMRFLEHLIEDKNEAGTSYYEFLQRIKLLIK